MKNLLIHNPKNSHTEKNRDYNLFWDDLTNELKKKYNVTENRFFENAHLGPSKIFLKKRTTDFLEVLECEYVIEDLDTGEFYILSVGDQITSGILSEQNNPFLKKILYSQYIPYEIVHHTKKNSHKYYPWIYFPQNIYDYDVFYEKRKTVDNFKNKMFFKGSSEYRPIINHFNKEILSDNQLISFENYLNDLITYKLVLTIGGAANGDICYRDIECMAIGVPSIRFEYVTTLNPCLIPNYHYISIPLPYDLPKHNNVMKDRLGNETHAKLIEQRFWEVVNDKCFLEFVSKNARDYYVNYLSKENRVKHTLKLLNL